MRCCLRIALPIAALVLVSERGFSHGGKLSFQGRTAPIWRGAPAYVPPWARGIDLSDSLSGWGTWWEVNRFRFLREPSRTPLDGEQVRGRVEPLLLEALEDGERSPVEHCAALVALARTGLEPARARRIIARYLRAEPWFVAEAAVHALGALGDPDSIPVLEELLFADKEGRDLCVPLVGPPRTGPMAGYALGRIGGTASEEVRSRVSELLVKRLTGEPEWMEVSIACILSLGLVVREEAAIDEIAAKVLWPLLDAPEPWLSDLVRAHVPVTLARMAAHLAPASELRRKWIRRFIECLADRRGSRYVRQALVLALGTLAKGSGEEDVAAAVAALKRARLGGRAAQVRFFALVSLGRIGTPGALAFLREELRGVEAPAVVLGLLLHPEARPPVAEVLKTMGIEAGDGAALVAKLQGATFAGERAACAAALGSLADARTLEALIAIAADGKASAETRAYALATLGLVSDRGELPWSDRLLEDLNYRACVPTLIGGGVGILDLL